MTWIWGVAAAVALLWPDRIMSALDGMPLDRAAEAILIGVLFPALWIFHPRFLTTRVARICIVALLAWKALATVAFVQDGWCVRFEPARPFAFGAPAGAAPHAWDVRADWRAADPACSAIMTRSYEGFADFPMWFFNMPPATDGGFPATEDRPPYAIVFMRVNGFIDVRTRGRLQFDLGRDIRATAQIDGRSVGTEADVEPGVHIIAVEARLRGERWSFVPRWNGGELWSSASPTVGYPTRINRVVRPWIRLIPIGLAAALLATWAVSLVVRIADLRVIAWSAAASAIIAALIGADHVDLARYAVAALAAAAFVPVAPRLRNLLGAFAMVGIPWMVFVVVSAMPAVGHYALYGVGHDQWGFQRNAYRIVMQGYWLEGGAKTFYFQPLYRWIAGLLHVVFGDSSVGEFYWDGVCLLAGGLLAFRIVRTYAGFRWGLAAAATPLAVFALGTAHDLIGEGLSEISSAGFISVAALCAIGGRRRPAAAIAAGILATLAFYTRLNNLIAALGVAVFALPLYLPISALVRPSMWWRRLSWRTALAVPAVMGIGLLLFAWRTYHYTGVFSVFYGTQRQIMANWQPGMPFFVGAGRAMHSVMMVLTVNDPPRFDVYALPVMAGAVVAILGLAGVPRLRSLPLAAVLTFFATIAGAVLTHGFAYPGRFSVHAMPITCALTICAVASARVSARRSGDTEKARTLRQDRLSNESSYLHQRGAASS
jgi:hypothetical protein